MRTEKELHSAFKHRKYVFRRKVFKLFGGAFHVYDESENLVFYSKQKPFKIREEFHVYSDESQREELLTIKTPQILDFSPTYSVYDATTGENVGALRRKGLKSIFKDEWIFLSNERQEIGKLTEINKKRAFLSRLVSLFPQL